MEKVKVKLTGQDGNTMNLLSICTRALKAAGRPQEAKELTEAVFGAASYQDALKAMQTYCDVS